MEKKTPAKRSKKPFLGRVPLGEKRGGVMRPQKGKGAYTRKPKHPQPPEGEE